MLTRQIRPHEDLDQFERLQTRFEDNLGRLQDHLERWAPLSPVPFTPAADLEESDDAYLVEIELAGVHRRDIDIATVGRRLVVTGERREKSRVGILRRQTRTIGEFRYEITLPGEFDGDDVAAGLEDGVLTIRLPKPEHERPRHITVS